MTWIWTCMTVWPASRPMLTPMLYPARPERPVDPVPGGTDQLEDVGDLVRRQIEDVGDVPPRDDELWPGETG